MEERLEVSNMTDMVPINHAIGQNDDRMHYALSCGAGVNSAANLHPILDKHMPLDLVIFADTGAEHPETYQYVEEWFKPFCQKIGIPFLTVKSHLPTLENYALEKGKTPSRQHRWCTDKWKIRPIYAVAPKPCTFYMGISYDEIERIHEPKQKGSGKYFFNAYPLVDAKITRLGCVKIIEEHGWPVPIKSGCFFCPFTRKRAWERLFLHHENLYDRAIKVEQSDEYYPQYTLTGNRVPLIKLKEKFARGLRETDLTDWIDDDPCDSGFCEVA